MIARAIETALAQRVLVFLLTLALIALGIQALRHTPIDAFPDVTTPQVKIILKSPGMTPGEIEQRITALVETEMLGIPRQKSLRSITKYALTDITITFHDGTDPYWARQQVAERLGNLRDRLPGGLEGGIAPMTTPLSDVMMFTLDSPHLSLADRRSLLDWVIRPALRTVPGVADVNALGGEVRTYEIEPDPVRMDALHITLDELIDALNRNNQNDGAGRLNEGEETLVIRSEGALTTLDDISALRILERDHQPITIADVARVRLGSLTRYGGVTHNGQGETVQGIVLALTGANANAVLQGVTAKLDEIRPALPEGVELNIFYNRSQLIGRAMDTISRALIEAIGLVLILLMLFLGHWRAALVVATMLPMTLLASFIWMQYTHLSANLMSLGGLIIALGMIVDSAVVVVENIVHHLSHHHASRLPRLYLIAQAVREVALPVSVGLTIIMLVFLPLLSLEEIEGKLFRPVTLSILFALISALLLALLVIPSLAASLLPKQAHADPQWLQRLGRGYLTLLRSARNHARLVFSAALAMLVAAALIYPQIGKIFLPTMDEGDILVQLEKIPSISLDSSLELDGRVQQALMQQIPEIKAIVARAGSDEIGLDPMGLNDTDSFLVLTPPQQWRTPHDKEAIKQAIRSVLDSFPGINTTLTQPIEMRVSEMLTGTRGDIAVKIFGTDPATLTQLAGQAADIIRPLPGAEEVFTPANDGVQYLTLALDHEHIRHYGLSVEQVQAWLRSQMEGLNAGTVYTQQRRIPIVLRGSGILDDQLPELLALPIPNAHAQGLHLGDIAHAQRIEGPVSISRENGQRLSSIIVNVGNRDLVGFVQDMQQQLQHNLPLPEGYYLSYGGQFESQQRVTARLMWVIPVGIGLIMILLLLTLKSWQLTLLSLATIPFALIGGVIGLWLSGEFLSLPASIGFIALLGIAVLNGVVLLDTFNQLRQQGLPITDVVEHGALRRLRPVLMTASIAALGLLPLLFATGPGSEIQRPLAVVVIGGLFTSTLLTLVLLPLLYERLMTPRTPAHD